MTTIELERNDMLVISTLLRDIARQRRGAADRMPSLREVNMRTADHFEGLATQFSVLAGSGDKFEILVVLDDG